MSASPSLRPLPTHPGPPLPADAEISVFVRTLRLRRALVGPAVRSAARLSRALGRPTPRLWVVPDEQPELIRLTRGDMLLTTGLMDRPDRVEGALALALSHPPVGPFTSLRVRTRLWLGWRAAQAGAAMLGLPQLARLLARLVTRLPAVDRHGTRHASDARAVRLVGAGAVRRALSGLSPRQVGGRLDILGPLRTLGGPRAVPGGPPPNWLRLHRLFGSGAVLPLPLPHADVELLPVGAAPGASA